MHSAIFQFIYTLDIYIYEFKTFQRPADYGLGKQKCRQLMPEFMVTFGTACNSCFTLWGVTQNSNPTSQKWKKNKLICRKRTKALI